MSVYSFELNHCCREPGSISIQHCVCKTAFMYNLLTKGKKRTWTCFWCGFSGKVSSKTLQNFCHLFLHEETNEGWGDIELQGEGHRYATLPLGHGGLESIGQSLHLRISTLSVKEITTQETQWYTEHSVIASDLRNNLYMANIEFSANILTYILIYFHWIYFL